MVCLKRSTRRLLWSLMLVLAGPPVGAADWPMYRGGPDLAGVTADPLPSKAETALVL